MAGSRAQRTLDAKEAAASEFVMPQIDTYPETIADIHDFLRADERHVRHHDGVPAKNTDLFDEYRLLVVRLDVVFGHALLRRREPPYFQIRDRGVDDGIPMR